MVKLLWRLMMLGPKTLYRLGMGSVIGDRVLILTTTGRVSGLPRSTPLQYEFIDNRYLLGSARGRKADWVKNILTEPRVSIQVGSKRYQARGRVVADPQEVAEFLEHRFVKHPHFLKLLFWIQGYQGPFNRETFLNYASNRVMVEINPLDE